MASIMIAEKASDIVAHPLPLSTVRDVVTSQLANEKRAVSSST